MNATSPAHPPSQARPRRHVESWCRPADHSCPHHSEPPQSCRNQPRDGPKSLIHGFRLSHMSRSCVGIADPLVVARPTAESITRLNYLSAAATRVDSFWVPDHLNALFPRSLWTPNYFGAAKLVPDVDAVLEPWTMLGHLAARNRFARLRLGVSVDRHRST